MRQQTTIPVFFTIDDGYTPWLAAALNSLARNADASRDYTVVVLHEGLSARNERRLAAIVEPYDHVHMQFVPMKGKIEGIYDRVGNRLRTDYFTMTIFFRLFIPAMFPQWDKGIYLDSDIVVPGDIAKLYDVELDGKLIGACHDVSIVDDPILVDYVGRAIGVGIENYVNSGVLLMDMKRLREARIDELFLMLFKTYAFQCVAPDQDYLNAMCFGRIHYLDASWDAMPLIGKPEMEHPQLIHYNLFMKPWCYDGIPYERYFWDSIAGSGFEQEARAFKASYTDEQRARDSATMQQLVSMAGDIMDSDGPSFARVFNTGLEARL